jgi:hypothetical protein
MIRKLGIFSWLSIKTVSGLDQVNLANLMKEIEPIPKFSGSKIWDGQPSSKNALNAGDFYYLLPSYSLYISKRLWNLYHNKCFYIEHKSQ